MKKLVIGTAVASGAALALYHCRDMLHHHYRQLLTSRHPQRGRGDATA